MSHRSVSAMHRFCAIAITVFLLAACADSTAPTATPLALSGAVAQTAPAAQANQPLPVTATSTPEPTPISTPKTEPTPTSTPPPPTPTPTEVGTATPSPTVEVTPGAVVRGDQNINLRKGPGSNYDGLGQIAPGALMEVVATAEMNGQTWYQVKLADGRLGWVRKDLVEANEKAGAVPKASDVPPTPTLQPRPTATPRPAATEVAPKAADWAIDPFYVEAFAREGITSPEQLVGQLRPVHLRVLLPDGRTPGFDMYVLYVKVEEYLGSGGYGNLYNLYNVRVSSATSITVAVFKNPAEHGKTSFDKWNLSGVGMIGWTDQGNGRPESPDYFELESKPGDVGHYRIPIFARGQVVAFILNPGNLQEKGVIDASSNRRVPTFDKGVYAVIPVN